MIRAGKIEGASQRVQEDTIKFTRIWKSWYKFIESVMVLIQFIPILVGLSYRYPNFLFW